MAFGWLKRPHRRWEESASAFVDGELGGASQRRFEAHLDGCRACREAVDGLRQAKALIAELPEIPAPRSFRLTPAMVQQPARPSPKATPSWGFRGAAMVAGVAAVALLAVVAVDVSRSSEDSTSQAVPSLNESTRQGALSTASGGAAGSSAQDSAAPPAVPSPSPANKGIASPDIGGTGAQALPTPPTASPAPGLAEPRVPVTGAAPNGSPGVTSNTYAATVPPSGALVPATGAPSEDEGEGASYRPIEAGLAALAAGAALGAVLIHRRKGRS